MLCILDELTLWTCLLMKAIIDHDVSLQHLHFITEMTRSLIVIFGDGYLLHQWEMLHMFKAVDFSVWLVLSKDNYNCCYTRPHMCWSHLLKDLFLHRQYLFIFGILSILVDLVHHVNPLLLKNLWYISTWFFCVKNFVICGDVCTT